MPPVFGLQGCSVPCPSYCTALLGVCATLTQAPILFSCCSSCPAAAGCPARLLPRRLLPPGRRPAPGTSPRPPSILHVWPHQARDLLHAPRRGTSPPAPALPGLAQRCRCLYPSFLHFCRGAFNRFQVLISLPTALAHGTICGVPLSPSLPSPRLRRGAEAFASKVSQAFLSLDFLVINWTRISLVKNWEHCRSFTKTWKSF